MPAVSDREIAPEFCGACRFDSTAYSDLDVEGALRALGPWWRITVQQRRAAACARPDPATWSAYEYAMHTAEVLDLLRLGTEWLLQEDGAEFPSIGPPPVEAEPADGDIAAAIERVETAALALHRLARDPATRSCSHVATTGDGTRVDPAWLVRHAVHDALHHLRDVGRGFVALGAGTPPHRGHVVQINTSGGGVPKSPVEHATIGYRGLDGDRQGDRKHHGRVFQAVCLFSAEIVDRFQAEGHPIRAGSVGENLTLSGIDWPALRPGTRLAVGDAVIELSVPAVPCAKNAQWFTDGDFSRLHFDVDPASTRWYASVMTDGQVATGDAVVVEP